HERRIISGSSQQERCRADSAEETPPRPSSLEPRVHIRSMLNQFPNKLQTADISRADWRRIPIVAVTVIWFADPRQIVERRKARPLIVGISPCLQQSFRQLEMAILDRQQ